MKMKGGEGKTLVGDRVLQARVLVSELGSRGVDLLCEGTLGVLTLCVLFLLCLVCFKSRRQPLQFSRSLGQFSP